MPLKLMTRASLDLWGKALGFVLFWCFPHNLIDLKESHLQQHSWGFMYNVIHYTQQDVSKFKHHILSWLFIHSVLNQTYLYFIRLVEQCYQGFDILHVSFIIVLRYHITSFSFVWKNIKYFILVIGKPFIFFEIII